MSLSLYLFADLGGPERLDVTGPWLNATHNLNPMWREVWGVSLGDLVDGRTAAETLPSLRAGLDRMVAEPETFQALNPRNGWGDYDGAVAFLRLVIERAEAAPLARWWVSA